jgi:hypothetical protein
MYCFQLLDINITLYNIISHWFHKSSWRKKVMKKLATIFSFSILVILLVVSNVLPVWASPSFNQAHNFSVSNAYTSNQQQNEIKKHIIVEKLVCRYINGKKRCWHD